MRWLDAREAAAWRALQVMQLRLTAQLSRELAADSGLSYQDYLVLVVLTEHPQGAVRQFELAELVGWERSRLSHHLSRMESRGLVARERCASDRRGAYVVVTGAGRREIAAAAPGHVAAVRRLFVDRLSPDQLEAVRDAAETVLGALDEECRVARVPGTPLADVGGTRVSGRTAAPDGRLP